MTRDNKELFYDRDKLYLEVWEHTLVKLCKQYEVSYSALVTACKTLNVPRPHSGYWTQKELGKAPPPAPLPPFDNPLRLLIHPPDVKEEPKSPPVKKAISQESVAQPTLNRETEVKQTTSTPDSDCESRAIQVPAGNTATKIFNWQDLIPKEGIVSPQGFEDGIQLIEKESFPDMVIIVPDTIENEHPYVKNTRLELERKTKDKSNIGLNNGRIRSYGKDLFDVNVGPDSVQRLLNILQSLCDAFEKRGFALVSEWNEDRKYGDIYVTIMGEKIAFLITERSQKIKLEKKDKNTYLDYEYVPTGKLTLENPALSSQKGCQYRWGDTKKISLEERLNDVVAGFIFAAAWKKEYATRRKIEEEKQKRREAIRKEEERLARIEKQRIVNFKKGTEHWVQYQNMAAFLATVKKAHRKSAKKNTDTGKWIRWASNYLAKYKTKFEDTARYDVEEYDEYKEKTADFRPIYNPPPEPYNYWKRPWYQRR